MEAVIRTLSSLAFAVVLVVAAAATAELVATESAATDYQVGELTPTPLESLAAQPGAKTIWSRPIGQLDSAASRATVTAVAVEEVTSTPQIMRGLRIDLVHLQPNPNCDLRFWSHRILCARPNAAIFFEEDSLGRVQAGVKRGNAENNLIISYRTGRSDNQTVGLIVGGYDFHHRKPEELITLIERGVFESTNAPR